MKISKFADLWLKIRDMPKWALEYSLPHLKNKDEIFLVKKRLEEISGLEKAIDALKAQMDLSLPEKTTPPKFNN